MQSPSILPQGIIRWSCTLALESAPGSSGRAVITFTTTFSLDSPRHRGCSHMLVMRERVIYWSKWSIRVLSYLHDFFFSKKGKQVCMLLGRRVKNDFFDAGLIINESKCNLDPALYLRQLGFDVDMVRVNSESRSTDGRPYSRKQTRSSQPEGEGYMPESSQA